MSCKDCEKERNIVYVRWKNANIEMIGCKKHLKEIINVLRTKKQEIIKMNSRKKILVDSLQEQIRIKESEIKVLSEEIDRIITKSDE